MLLLDAPQLQEQAVELRVGDLGRVEHVVRVLVAADLLAQAFGAADQVAGGFFLLAHLVRGASMPERIFSPALSNFTTSSSSVRVSVLLTTVPEPNDGCVTRSPVANRCTGGGAGAAWTWRSWKRSL